MKRRLFTALKRIVVLATPRKSLLLALVLLWIAGFSVFFTVGKVAVIDTHFTQRPENYPQFFRLTDWRPTPSRSVDLVVPAGMESILTRSAIYPMNFVTVRYTQASFDAGVTAETIRYDVDIRWGPTGAAIAISIIALVVLHLIGRLLIGYFSER